MIRKQLYLERHQDQSLKRLARERGVSEAALVRQAVEQYVSAPPPTAAGIWAREVQFMRDFANAHQGTPQRPRDWTREELYEERMKRYDRDPG